MKLETFFDKFDQFADAPDAVAHLRDVVYSVGLAAEKWPHESLESVALKVTDGTHQTPRYVETGIPFVSVKDFSGGSLDMSATRFITPEEHSEIYKRCDPKRGDILLGRIGTIGKAVVVDTDIEFSLFVSAAQIRPDRGKILSRYLQYVLNSPFCRAQFDNIKVGGATHTNKLNLKDLRSVKVPLPPLAEQKRIVAKVDELMELCDRLEAQQQERETRHAALSRASLARFADAPSPANLPFLFHPSYAIPPADLRKSILTLAVQGKLVPQDPNDEDARDMIDRAMAKRQQTIKTKSLRRKELDESAELFEHEDLPSSWCVERFANLVDPENTISYGVLVPGNDVRDGIPFVRAQDLCLSNHPARPNKTIAPEIEKLYARTRLIGGEILLCVVGSIGKLGVVPDSWAGANIARAVARIKPIPDVLRDYLLLVLQEQSVQNYFTSTTRTLAQPTLNVGMIEQTPIPIPPIAEQRRIVAKVEQLMSLVDALETQLAASRATAANLLSALVAELTAA